MARGTTNGDKFRSAPLSWSAAACEAALRETMIVCSRLGEAGCWELSHMTRRFAKDFFRGKSLICSVESQRGDEQRGAQVRDTTGMGYSVKKLLRYQRRKNGRKRWPMCLSGDLECLGRIGEIQGDI